MKLAVLSDIHGNKPALDAVLDDAEKENVDQILILGDLITDFPRHTNIILDTVRSLDAWVIRGNREEYLIAKSKNESVDDWQSYKQFSSLYDTWRMLRDEDIRYLESLPSQIACVYDDNFSFRMVHGSPFPEIGLLLEEHAGQIERSLESIAEKYLLCGHTHRPFQMNFTNKTILNPGSVGMNFTGNSSAQYAIIDCEDSEIVIEMKEIPYDFEWLKREASTDDFWVKTCLKSLEDGVNYNVEFLEEAQVRFGLWPIPNDKYDELSFEWLRSEWKIH